jgi:hypothetical protein
MSPIITPQSTRLKALLQQSHQRRGSIGLPFRRDVLSEGVGRALDQHTQDRVRVHVGFANHANHLGKDGRRIGSAGGDDLHTPDQLIHGSKRTVGHGTKHCRSGGDGATLDWTGEYDPGRI